MIDAEKIKPKIAELAKKYNLSLVVLFGSQASGKTHFGSDTDIAFLAEEKKDLMDVAKMEIDFIETLKTKKIELVSLKEAHPLLLKQVAEKSILLYEKTPFKFALFKIYAFKRFMEAKKLLELREASLNNFLQKNG